MIKVIMIEIAIALVAVAIIIEMTYKKSMKKMAILSAITLGIMGIVILITLMLQKPLVDLKDVVEIEVNSGEQIKVPTTIYMFKDITDDIKINGEVDYTKVGIYNVEYEIPILFRKVIKKQTVNIVDTTPPEIILEGKEEIELSYKKEYEEPGFTAIDNCDGDLKEKVEIEKKDIDENNIEIIYSVSDGMGNKISKTRKIKLIDDVAPVITLNGKQTVSIIVGEEYKESGAKAIDEKDGDLTSKIVISGSVDTSKIGTYTITYKVADSKGNEATKNRTISVIKEPVKAQTGTDGAPGVIYLTFDDGPSASITPKILDILKKKNVPATFFIINYSDSEAALVKREHNEGHTVAIHGYSHEYKSIYTSEETYMSNITKLQDKIKNTIGYAPTITRFPGGSSNTVSRFNPGIMTRLTSLVLERGYKYFDWNVSSGDAGEAKSSTAVYNNVTKGLKKDRANIVLMHDFSGNTKTLNALEDIINYGINNGYTFSRITESTPMVTHSVNN